MRISIQSINVSMMCWGGKNIITYSVDYMFVQGCCIGLSFFMSYTVGLFYSHPGKVDFQFPTCSHYRNDYKSMHYLVQAQYDLERTVCSDIKFCQVDPLKATLTSFKVVSH